jgi:hypothetical protein
VRTVFSNFVVNTSILDAVPGLDFPTCQNRKKKLADFRGLVISRVPGYANL